MPSFLHLSWLRIVSVIEPIKENHNWDGVPLGVRGGGVGGLTLCHSLTSFSLRSECPSASSAPRCANCSHGAAIRLNRPSSSALVPCGPALPLIVCHCRDSGLATAGAQGCTLGTSASRSHAPHTCSCSLAYLWAGLNHLFDIRLYSSIYCTMRSCVQRGILHFIVTSKDCLCITSRA